MATKEDAPMLVAVAKLTSDQITLPPEVWQRLGVQEGDYIDVVIEDDRVVLKAGKSWVERTKGLGKEMWEAEGGGEAAIRRERESWGDR
jgi:AbrB family looped-hinge helix DNA binding protein